MMTVYTYYLLPSANISMSDKSVKGTFSLITCQLFYDISCWDNKLFHTNHQHPFKGQNVFVVSM